MSDNQKKCQRIQSNGTQNQKCQTSKKKCKTSHNKLSDKPKNFHGRGSQDQKHQTNPREGHTKSKVSDKSKSSKGGIHKIKVKQIVFKILENNYLISA